MCRPAKMPPKHQRKKSDNRSAPQKGEMDPIFFHKEWDDFGFMSNYAPAKFFTPDPAIVCKSWLASAPTTTAAASDERPDARPDAHMDAATSKVASSDEIPIIEFQFSEQYYMYCKAACFGDAETCQSILAASKAGDCKDAARHICGFDSIIWDSLRLRVMEDALWLKFGGAQLQQVLDDGGEWLNRDARLQTLNDHGRKLLATGDRLLVEAAGRDSFWGIGYGIKQRPMNYQKNWGQNQLGKSLVATRERLRKLLENST